MGYQISVLKQGRRWFTVIPANAANQSSLAAIYPVVQQAFPEDAGFELRPAYVRRRVVRIGASLLQKILHLHPS